MNTRSNSLSFLIRPDVSATLLLSVALSRCETPGQTALLGAATGAAVGGALHGHGRDAQYARRSHRGYYDRDGYWHPY